MDKYILAVFDDNTEKYVDRKVNLLNDNSIPTVSGRVEWGLPVDIAVTMFPALIFVKNGKPGLQQIGKWDDKVVLAWAKKFNW